MASNPHDDAIYSTADDRKSRAHTGNDDMLYDTSDTGGQPQPYKMQPMEMGGSDGLDQPLIAHGRHRESSAPLRYGSHHVWLSHVLVFLNIVCFFIEMSVNKWEFAPLSQNFLFGPSVTGLIKAGAQTSFCIKDQNQGWRLVTAAFLHGGILHLLFNMYALSVIAPFLERDFGALKLFFLYFGAGCSAALATALMLPNTVSVGASGAICGLLGALWAELLMNCGNSHNAKSGINQNKFCQLLFNTILLLAMSLLPDVNFFAHFFGMLFGTFLGMAFTIRQRYAGDSMRGFVKKRMTNYQVLLALVGFCAAGALLVFMFFALLIKDYDLNGYCPYCKYFQCIPSSVYSCPGNTVPCQNYATVADGMWWYSCMGENGGVAPTTTAGMNQCALGTTCAHGGDSYMLPATFDATDPIQVQNACMNLCGGYCPTPFA